MKGKIKRYLDSKGYGFIDGEDGKSYYFHTSDVTKDCGGITEGLFVSFDEHLTERGFRAKRVAPLAVEATCLRLLRGFHSNASGLPAGVSIMSCARLTIRDRDLNKARTMLVEDAKSVGANGLVNKGYNKETGSLGNYQYTVHVVSGDCAVLAEKVVIDSEDQKKRYEDELTMHIGTVDENIRRYREEHAPKPSSTNWIAAVVLGLLLLGFIIARMR